MFCLGVDDVRVGPQAGAANAELKLAAVRVPGLVVRDDEVDLVGRVLHEVEVRLFILRVACVCMCVCVCVCAYVCARLSAVTVWWRIGGGWGKAKCASWLVWPTRAE